MPLEAAVVLCAASAIAGAWAGYLRANRRLDPRRLSPQVALAAAPLPARTRPVDLTARRDALRAGSRAVLHGRIDHFVPEGSGVSPEMRDQVIAHIAAVVRAGLRRDDRIALGEDAAGGDGFTIIIPGADERAAVRIANRLRRKLAQLHLPHIGSGAQLTASFGVAAERFGESREGLESRARRALDAALAQGSGQIVPASDIDDAVLLPAPVASPTASAA